MGASAFKTIANGKTAADAFGTARSDALYMEGHGGYTGTIAEKSGFTMRRSGIAMTRPQALAFAEDDIQSNEKQADAYCVAICADSDPKVITSYLFYGYASD
jgi:hypothetical protein